MFGRIESTLLAAVACILIVGAIWLFLHSLIFPAEHDWDLDAFLYLGSRLNENELLYISDFETKLPLVQYLFSPASSLGGIGAWRILTLFMVVAFGGCASYLFAVYCLEQSEFDSLNIRTLTMLVTGLFLFTLYSLPGSESGHIEMISASTAYLAFVLALTSNSPTFSKPITFLAGVFLSVAAMIRPNYVYLFPVFVLWIFTLNIKDRTDTPSHSPVLWFLTGFSIVCLAVFLPYAFVETGPAALIDSLKEIAEFSEGTGFRQLILEQLRDNMVSSFYLSMYSGSILLFLLGWSFETVRIKYLFRCGIPAVISFLTINVSISQTHYYPHHTIMFVPFVVLITSLLFLVIVKARSVSPHSLVYPLVGVLFFCLMGALPFYQAFQKFSDIGKANFEINERGIDRNLVQFLREQRERGRNFLTADLPIYHMLLGEKRIGDGHPAMLVHILGGKRIGPISDIRIYSEEVHRNPCLALLESNKDWIILVNGTDLDDLICRCLATDNGIYKEIEIEGLRKYRLFLKMSASVPQYK